MLNLILHAFVLLCTLGSLWVFIELWREYGDAVEYIEDLETDLYATESELEQSRRELAQLRDSTPPDHDWPYAPYFYFGAKDE